MKLSTGQRIKWLKHPNSQDQEFTNYRLAKIKHKGVQ